MDLSLVLPLYIGASDFCHLFFFFFLTWTTSTSSPLCRSPSLFPPAVPGLRQAGNVFVLAPFFPPRVPPSRSIPDPIYQQPLPHSRLLWRFKRWKSPPWTPCTLAEGADYLPPKLFPKDPLGQCLKFRSTLSLSVGPKSSAHGPFTSSGPSPPREFVVSRSLRHIVTFRSW